MLHSKFYFLIFLCSQTFTIYDFIMSNQEPMCSKNGLFKFPSFSFIQVLQIYQASFVIVLCALPLQTPCSLVLPFHQDLEIFS